MERLREEHLKAIKSSKERLKKWKTFDNDYQTLQTQLKTLPLKLTHNVMVPITSVAYMPGQLHHTNEILVLLGDNWFVKRTANQAHDIVDRRRAYISDEISKEEKYLNDISSQHLLVGNVQKLDEDVVEIKEEYDPIKEEEWRKNRKERRKEAKDLISHQTDEDIWSRLNELEREEERDSIEETTTENTLVISFTHTKDTTETQTHSRTETHSILPKYQTPGDIYDAHRPFNVSKEQETVQHAKSVKWNIPKTEKVMSPKLTKPSPMPFSGFVIEKNITSTEEGTQEQVEQGTPQKVSKFKASRSK